MNYHDDIRLNVPSCTVFVRDIDEAEETGILGPDGRMLVRYYGRRPIGFVIHGEQDDEDEVV